MWWIVTLLIVVGNAFAIWKVRDHWKRKYDAAKKDYEKEYKDQKQKWESERTVFRENINGLMDQIQTFEVTKVGMQQQMSAEKSQAKEWRLRFEKEERLHAQTKKELHKALGNKRKGRGRG